MSNKQLVPALALLALVAALFLSRDAAADVPVSPSEITYSCAAVDLTTSGGAAITSAVSGKSQAILAFSLASTSAQAVTFKDGSAGTALATVYFEANTPQVIRSDVFGDGIKGSSGNAIYAEAAAGTLSGVIRTRLD